jgi:hypothetical protein
MSLRLKKHVPFLRRLLENPNIVPANDEIAILIEIIYNVVRGNPKLRFSQQEVNILRKEMTLLKELALIRNAKTARKVFKSLSIEALHSLINPCLENVCFAKI